VSERRCDPTADEWVTFATHRQDRTYQPPPEHRPLCPTRDPANPTEIPRSSFDIAVFDNRFPSLSDDYRRRTGRCVECDVVAGEIAGGRRIIARRGGVVAFAPVHRTADKIKYVAGSELMGGAYLTDVASEVAAESLRRAVG
jgi:galactose-1-phosphate uridylyltransferase